VSAARPAARTAVKLLTVLTVCGFGLLATGFDYALLHHEVVRSGPADSRAVALTFDDGPGMEHTPQILDILAQRDAHATFFVVGESAVLHPALIQRMRSEGHEIAAHTATHPIVGQADAEELEREFEASTSALSSLGIEPAWYRPPRGELCFEQKRLAREYGMGIALWTRSVERASFSSAEQMALTLVGETRSGDVLLAHDGRLDRSMTVRALPMILDGLEARGIRAVTVSELCDAR